MKKSLRSRTIALAVAVAAAGFAGGAAAQALRAEIGTPLKAASELLRAGKAREALAKVREAEAVGGKSSAEQLTIDRMKAAAAQRAGDTNTAIDALEGIAGKVSGAEYGQIAEQLASAYAQQRNNSRASEWLNKAVAAGNNSATVQQLRNYLQSASGDYGSIAKAAAANIASAEQAGRRPDEGELLRLADAQQHLGNNAGQAATLEKLLYSYPKKDYWAAYLSRLPRKPGFSDRFSLDVLRLRLATGNLSATDDFMEMAQLALQAGLPGEAVEIVDKGYKAGALGTGAEAARHQRLKDLALKQQAEQKTAIETQVANAAAQPTGDDLVKVGNAYAAMGDGAKGAELIEQGIRKGGLKRPEDAKLRLGLAQLKAGNKSKAAATLRSIKGTDGVADIARLWLVAS